MKKGQKETMEGIKLSNKENTRTLREKENYKFPGILKTNIK